MTLQYLRKVSFVVGNEGDALDFSQFRVTFNVRRGDYQNPNSCDLRIFNLSDSTANRIHDEFTQVAVQAGYEGNFGLIFRGTIKQVRKGRLDQLDSYVDVTAADGDEAYNFSTMALSLAAGATPSDSVQAFLKVMASQAINQGYTPELSTNGSVRGKVFYGATKDEVRKFAMANQLSWNLNDGRLSFIPLTSYVPSANVPVISPQTGLIGVPEQTQNGIEMRVLLNPSIKIGQLVQLDSTALNLLRYGLDVQSQATNIRLSKSVKTSADGLYYVMVANHMGDTRENSYYTDLVCLAVDASVPADAAAQAAIQPSAASIRLD